MSSSRDMISSPANIPSGAPSYQEDGLIQIKENSESNKIDETDDKGGSDDEMEF